MRLQDLLILASCRILGEGTKRQEVAKNQFIKKLILFRAAPVDKSRISKKKPPNTFYITNFSELVTYILSNNYCNVVLKHETCYFKTTIRLTK